MPRARSGWLEWSGFDEMTRGLGNLLAFTSQDYLVYIDLEERSVRIIYYHREPFLEAFNEAAMGDATAKAFGETTSTSPADFPDADIARQQIGKAQGEFLRQFLQMVQEQEDLEDTGRFKDDLANAPIVVEEK